MLSFSPSRGACAALGQTKASQFWEGLAFCRKLNRESQMSYRAGPPLLQHHHTCRAGQPESGVHRIAKSAAIANDKPSMSNESSALASAATEADRVVKRQKICSTKFADAVDGLLAAVNDSRNRLQDDSTENALNDLKQHVTQLGVSSELHDQTKQLHGAIAKLGKVLIASTMPTVSIFD